MRFFWKALQLLRRRGNIFRQREKAMVVKGTVMDTYGEREREGYAERQRLWLCSVFAAAVCSCHKYHKKW